jgi:hypothetical protein
VRLGIDPNCFGFASPEGQRRIPDADNKGITPRPRFRNDLDVLTATKAEFEQTANEGGEASGSGAHADDHPLGSG